MQDNVGWPQLRYHKIQSEIWTCPKRFVYLAAGRQSGKTELSMRRLIRYLPIKKPWPNPKYFYAAPTLKQAKRVAWDRLQSLILPHWVSDISLSDLRIKTIFGSELFLDGLDAPHRIEGQILDGGVIDEAADIKPESYSHSVHGTLVTRQGWCWTIGVCKRFGIGAVEFRDSFMAAANEEMPNSAAFTWPSSSVLSKEELEIARAKCDERTFEEQYNATFLTASGGIFYAFNREYNVRPCAYDTNLPLVVGSDFNVNPMSWVISHIKGDVLEIFDEIWLRNTNTPESLGVLLSRYGKHKGGFQMYGDASARARKTSAYMTDYAHLCNDVRLKALGRTMHYINSNPPVADRFASTNARICNGAGQRNVFIDSHCKHLIHDLEVRSYKPGTREADDSGDIGHPTDALGYILHRRWPLTLVLPTSNEVIIRTG